MSSAGESDPWRRDREAPQRSEHGDSEDWGSFERFKQVEQAHRSRRQENNDYGPEQDRANARVPPSWNGATDFEDYLLPLKSDRAGNTSTK